MRSFFLGITLFFFFSACKKTEIPAPPSLLISINQSEVTLAKDQFFLARLEVKLENLPAGESDEIKWTTENPRIATVTNEGLVYPQGAGVTYITATLVSGKGSVSCKVTITDGNDYKFRLTLKDKGTSSYSIGNPSAFLSAKAIARRQKFNIEIDETDLPISPGYLNEIQKVGCKIVAKSKWLNQVTVHCSDEFLVDKYLALPFVKEARMVWMGKRLVTVPSPYVDVPQQGNNKINGPIDYGGALVNITPNNGSVLHEKGFKGAGIDIAVIDAGFINLKQNPALQNINIKGAKSFIYEISDPYTLDNHGVWVTSCMAGNQPGKYVGTAPEASYWLLHTEDSPTEQPIEEDYWANAVEFADSAGVDIVNSSLSYSFYNRPEDSYKFTDMDGKTAVASRAANLAAKKGLVIVNCAGNDQTWVGTPADSPYVLTLGSINKNFVDDAFTSFGITVDGRMKPDVMAKGGSASVIGIIGTIETRSGTSYASPIMCGLIACLWQAYPKLNNMELMEIVRKSADKANNPVVPYGYGVPDMQKAMNLAKAALAGR